MGLPNVFTVQLSKYYGVTAVLNKLHGVSYLVSVNLLLTIPCKTLTHKFQMKLSLALYLQFPLTLPCPLIVLMHKMLY